MPLIRNFYRNFGSLRQLLVLVFLVELCVIDPVSLRAETFTFWVGNLQNDLVLVRKHAAIKLGEIQDTRALEPLHEALTAEPKADVRLAIIEALIRLGNMESVNKLLSISKKDKDYYVRFHARKAITRIREYNERLEEKRRLREEEEAQKNLEEATDSQLP